MENFKKYCKEKSIGFFLPIAFVLAIVPLIVRAKKVDIDHFSQSIWGKSVDYDLFSQDKAILLIFFSIILLIILGFYFRNIIEKKDKIVNIILICSGIFLILSLISSILSPYKHIALFGVYNRAEGFITIACYFILFIYSIYTFKNTNEYKCIIIPILIVVFINAFLGIFQYAGHDLIETKLGSLFVLPTSITKQTGGKLSLLYESGKLYGTLFHYNYVGSFVAIVLPILFCAIFIAKNYIHKVILGFGVVASLWLLFGSTSRAGLVGIFVSILLGIIIFSKIIFKNKKQLIATFGSLIVVIIALNFLTNGSVFIRVPSMFKDAFSIFNNTSTIDYRDQVPVKDIVNANDHVELVFQKDTLNISFENDKYKFTNANGDEIKIKKSNDVYLLDDNTFSNVSFKLYKLSKTSTKMDVLKLIVNNNANFLFRVKVDDTIHLINTTSFDYINVETPETFGFAGKEKLGSARGYIWSRSIPLLKNNLLIGKGPDTFVLRFPQNDLIGKYYAYGTPNIIVDKPHNLYLQIGLNNGVLALIAFLIIMLTYVIDSFRLYSLKKTYTKDQLLGAATALSVIAYLFAGIFNDSIISVAPIFWVVLGVGVSLNYKNRKA